MSSASGSANAWATVANASISTSDNFFTGFAAHSDDSDQPFQRIPISHSDRSRSVWCGVSAPLDAFLISVFSPGVKQG
jgi:hypothetical protein